MVYSVHLKRMSSKLGSHTVVKSDDKRYKYNKATQSRMLVSGKETGDRVTIFEQILNKDQYSPNHTHFVDDEIFYILNGSFKFTINDDIIYAKKGDFIHVRPNTFRSFISLEDNSKFLGINAPSRVEHFLHDLAKNKQYPPSKEWWKEMEPKHLMQFDDERLTKKHQKQSKL